MPRGESTLKVERSKQNLEDPEAVKEKILEDVRQRGGAELEEGERNQIIYRLLEHSVEDGLDMADYFGMSTGALMEGITRAIFVIKHPQFAEQLTGQLLENQGYADQKDGGQMLDLLGDIAPDDAQDTVGWASSVDALSIHGSSPLGKELVRKLDQAYAPFLSTREIGSKESQDESRKQSKGERLAWANLEQAYLALKPQYYAGAVRDILEKAVHGNPLSPSIEQMLQGESYVSEEKISQVFKEMAISPDRPDIARQLAQARYKPLETTYRAESTMAKKALEHEVLDSLHRRGVTGVKVIKDAHLHEYDVIRSEEEAHMEAPNVREFDLNFLTRREHPLLEGTITSARDAISVSYRGYDKIGTTSLVFSNGQKYAGEHYFPTGNNRNKAHVIEYSDKREFGIILSNGQFGGHFTGWPETHWIGNEEYLFVVKQAGGKGFVVVYPDGSSSKPYVQIARNSFTNSFTKIMDGIAFLALKEPEEWVVVSHNGREDPAPNNVHSFQEIDGRFAFVVPDRLGEQLIYPDGQRSQAYDRIVNVLDMGDGHATLEVADGGWRFLVYPDGRESKKYDVLHSPIRVKDGVAFVHGTGDNGDKQRVAFPDGSESRAYHEVSSLIETSEGVAFKARIGVKYCVVYADGTTSAQYDSIPSLRVISGEVVFVAEESGTQFLVYPDGSRSEAFDAIEYFSVEQGHVQVTARKGKKLIQFEGWGFEDPIENARDTSGGVELTEEEEWKLLLLGFVEWPEHVGAENIRYELDEFQEALGTQTAKGIMTSLREAPEAFLGTMAAMRDTGARALAQRVVDRLFPLVAQNRWRAQQAAGLFGRNRKNTEGRTLSPAERRQNALTPNTTGEMRDGDPTAKGIEVMTLRQPVSEILVTGVYAGYNKETGKWSRDVFPTAPPEGAVKEVTAEIPVTPGQGRMVLPLAVGAAVLPERVRGVTKKGKEVAVDVQVDAGGGATIEVPKGIVRILYSQNIPQTPVAPYVVSANAYDTFRRNTTRHFGESAGERVPGLPEEEKLFLRSIQKLPPLERAVAIQQHVLNRGHYDFANKEMQAQKQGASLAETFGVMRRRMTEFKKRDSKNETLKGKVYAGVCADFAKLTTAMLRESGLLSGLLRGFHPGPETTSVTTEDAHLASFVLWPAENGKVSVVPVDATPSGGTPEQEKLLAHIRTPSLEDQMEVAEQASVAEQVGSDTRLAELEAAVAHLDEAAVRKMENGELERTLNAILAGVRHSHVAALERALSAARYAGINVPAAAEGTDPKAKLEALRLLEDEIANERASGNEESGERRGGALIKLITDYAARYTKEHPQNPAAGLEAVDRILSLAENALDPVERRAAAAVVTYLRAQRMLRSTKTSKRG